MASDPHSAPLVSITMPTYNRAHMVGKAIDAVLAQTYQNWELIMVNDGSKDKTAEVLEQYRRRDSRIRVINKQNQGIPDTVNRGFSESKGEYLTWSSDDNYYHAGAIARMAEYLLAHPEVMFVYTDTRYIDPEGKVVREHQGGDPELLAKECPIMGCLMFRREVLNTVDPFRKQWVRGHDYEFYRRVWMKHKIARIAEVHYDYLVHEESMSGNYVAIATEHALILTEYAQNRTEVREAWGWRGDAIGRYLHKNGRPWLGVWYYLKACWHQPHRLGKFWDVLWRTAYGSLPQFVKNGWRWTKRRLGLQIG